MVPCRSGVVRSTVWNMVVPGVGELSLRRLAFFISLASLFFSSRARF